MIKIETSPPETIKRKQIHFFGASLGIHGGTYFLSHQNYPRSSLLPTALLPLHTGRVLGGSLSFPGLFGHGHGSSSSWHSCPRLLGSLCDWIPANRSTWKKCWHAQCAMKISCYDDLFVEVSARVLPPWKLVILVEYVDRKELIGPVWTLRGHHLQTSGKWACCLLLSPKSALFPGRLPHVTAGVHQLQTGRSGKGTAFRGMGREFRKPERRKEWRDCIPNISTISVHYAINGS